MDDLQGRVRACTEELGLRVAPNTRLLDLASEVGELSKEYLKATEYGARPFAATAAWAEELGDTLFTLLCLAEETGVEASQALDLVLDKYRNRVAAKGSPQSDP